MRTGGSPSADGGFCAADQPDNLNAWLGNAEEEEEESVETAVGASFGGERRKNWVGSNVIISPYLLSLKKL